jgi:hypothetical protein
MLNLENKPMAKTKTIKKIIGHVGVDSGQILVCDPCYIESEWKKQEFFDDRAIKDTETDKIYVFRVHFENYEGKIKGIKGTINELLKSGRFVHHKMPNPHSREFSYAGACDATLGKDLGGELNYKAGHGGVGVAVSSGYGDGLYPVIAEYIDEGMGLRIKRITVDFMGTYTQKFMKELTKKL